MSNIETTYTFITFIDDNGVRQLQPYNDTLLKMLKTENKVYVFESKDYKTADQESIEYFNKESVNQPQSN